MPLNNPKVGVNWVSEYQVSAIPWVTSSVVTGMVQHKFPKVTRFVTIRNLSGSEDLLVGFTELGVASSSNYIVLQPGDSFSEELRIRTLYVSGTSNRYNLIVGLTMINSGEMINLTGSNEFQGVG